MTKIYHEGKYITPNGVVITMQKILTFYVILALWDEYDTVFIDYLTS